MPKEQTNQSMVAFPGGLNTEANRFDYPPECTVDEQNFIITKDGKRERRLGIILGDEDTNMVPDGCEFNDVLRIKKEVPQYKHTCTNLAMDSSVEHHVWIDEDAHPTKCPFCNRVDPGIVTVDHDPAIIEDVEYLGGKETYEEVVNVNTTAEFTGLQTLTVNFSNNTKWVIQVYDNGAYVTSTWVTALGGQTLLGKWFGSGIFTFPFSIRDWNSNQNTQPVLQLNISKRATFTSELKAIITKLINNSTTKTYTLVQPDSPMSVISTDGNYGQWRGGWRYYKYHKGYSSTGRSIYQEDVYYERMRGVYIDYSAAGFIEPPALIQWQVRSNYKGKGWSGWSTYSMPLGNLASKEKNRALLVDNTAIPNGWSFSAYKTSYEFRWYITGTTYDKVNLITLQNSTGDTFTLTACSQSDSPSTHIKVITGTEAHTITKSKSTAVPVYEALVDAMSDPTAYAELVKATYNKYENKTRIQIGKIASVADRTVPIHYVWKNAGGMQGKEFSVFYNQYKVTICEHSPPFLFNNIKYTTIGIGADDVASVDGKLVIVNHNTDIIHVIEYDPVGDTFIEDSMTLKTRDQWGLNESKAFGSKSKTWSGSSYHKYGGTYTLDIKHNQGTSDRSNFSVVCTGGKLEDSGFSWACTNSNTIRITYHQKGGKSKSTCSFKVTYTYDTGIEIQLDEKQRCAPNQIRLYNLYNRGWGLPRKNESGSKCSPVALFNATYSKYPSLDESVYTALQLNPGYYDADAKTWKKAWERLYPELWDDSRNAEDNSIPAAPGAAIIEVCNRGESRFKWYKENIKTYDANPSLTSLPTDRTEGGPTCCCDYAGRMFYAGFSNTNVGGDNNSPFLGSYVFFSQLVKKHDDLNKCYQEGDPSSRTESDILDTDGGFFRVSGAEGIVKMVQTQKGMLIFAQNGVWLLMGGADYGFSANNHKVSKLTSFGVNQKYSICGTGDQWMYFSDGGIMVLAPDQFGDMQVKNISYNTIHTLFKNYQFPQYGVVGAFDPVTSQYHWMVECNSEYSTELIYNSAMNIFTQNVFYNNPQLGQYVMAPICLDEEFHVENLNSLSNYRNYQSTCYLCRDQSWDDDMSSEAYGQAINAEYRVGYCGNRSFMDFGRQDAAAYMMSGPNNWGDVGLYKQTPWLNMYMMRSEKEDTENNPINKSSCRVSVTWDWAIDKDTHRWTKWVGNDGNGNVKELDYFEVYRHRQPIMLTKSRMLPSWNEVVESRSKIRGRGKVLQFIMRTTPGFDCRIAGMNITVNANKYK